MRHVTSVSLVALLTSFAHGATWQRTLAPAPGPYRHVVDAGEPSAVVVLPARPDDIERSATDALKLFCSNQLRHGQPAPIDCHPPHYHIIA